MNAENKREVDKVIHGIVRVSYKDCPSSWRGVKRRIAEDEDAFALKLKEKWSKRS